MATHQTSQQSAILRIGLVGQGALFDAVRHVLQDSYDVAMLDDPLVIDSSLRDYKLIVSCDDQWRPRFQRDLNARVYADGVPWLRAYLDFGTGIVGPFVTPPDAGCVYCVQARRNAAISDRHHVMSLGEQMEEQSAHRAQHAVHSLALETLSGLVLREIAAQTDRSAAPRTREALLRVDLISLAVMRHHFLPLPICPVCGDLPEDRAEDARITIQPRQKLSPTSYHLCSLTDMSEHLLTTYVDTQVGLAHALLAEPGSVTNSVSARVGLDLGYGMVMDLPGYGRATSYRKSQSVALTEALERYGGQFPLGKRTVVRASYAQVRDDAANPERFGLPSPEAERYQDSWIVPFHEDLEINWVWGYSLSQQRPLLVPERFAYYGVPLEEGGGNPMFAYECSNGCALGSCLEEAALHGLFEVAERDAFLLTWYARLGLRQLDLTSVRDPHLRMLIKYTEQSTGYVMHAFDSTLDHPMPCIWLVGVNEDPDEKRGNLGKLVVSAGASLSADRALESALLEIAASLPFHVRRYEREEERRRIAAMCADPYEVRTLEDHPAVYLAPEAFARFDFLLTQPRMVRWDEAFHGASDGAGRGGGTRLPTNDLSVDLMGLVSDYNARGLEVIVVDQTSPDHARLGFSCVKVLVPGTLPMTFGHANRRYRGISRLFEVPHQLGYTAQPLTNADINPHPHPFC